MIYRNVQIELRIVHLLTVLGVLLFTTSIISVFAAYSVGPPIIGSKGAPALNGHSSPSQYAGIFTVTYANGRPVDLSLSQTYLRVCGSTCVSVVATITQTAPGTYAYSYVDPSLEGTLTVEVPADSLVDDNGKPFPSVDTQVGAYFVPAKGAPPAAMKTQAVSTTATQQQSSSRLMRVAQEGVAQQETPFNQLMLAVVVGVSVLAVCALVVLPSRKG